MCFKRQRLCDAINRLAASIEHSYTPVGIDQRLSKLEAKMSDIQTAVSDATAAETALEARVTAHEAHEEQVAAALQTQIDALTAKLGADDQSVKDLVALKAKMDAFDSTAAAAPGP